ncbi:YciI family protein [Paracoccus sp. TOH]|uniref:YciI family protein n=1 Tax=Paracoccus simplex TaxID=2086346 RepID=A0ABV7RTB5_9RHOB|nr:YciI family protein [Paracoccus sp. TOH]WJS86937.1 YciI family protein [Paracoccus sp. TOH]
MRVMVLVKATEESEAGVMPTTGELDAMTSFNEELAAAGVMLAGEGLHPSARGRRIRFGGAAPLVLDGPFAETKELVAGFWLWQVASMQEALDWAKRAPFRSGELELRPVFESEEFGDELTPDLRAREAELRRKQG